MTKEELEKEAEKWRGNYLGGTYGLMSIGTGALIDAYLAGAEPREKRIAELEAQIEKMKCCGNCACLCECGIKGFDKCKNYNKWELKEIKENAGLPKELDK